MEEYRAITLHPRGDRALHLIYTYPAGDDKSERGNALAELAGELGSLDADSLSPSTEPPVEP
jgi:hypothetical protein